nr:acyl-CoA dehydrogenase family protein [Sphingomonas sp. CDS-1]
MTFSPPVTEQQFVLEHVAHLSDFQAHDLFSAAGTELVDAVLEGAAAMASSEWAPTNRIGDVTPPVWRDGEVTMPAALKKAYQAFVQGGWGTIAVPVEYGGQGLPNVLGVAVSEAIGTANMGLSLCPLLTGGTIEAIAHHGSAELKEAYLARLVSGEWSGTMNLTEPQAGSDVGALRSTAVPNDDGSWRIKGTKIFITYGEHDLADNIVHLVLARTPAAPAGTRGISLFLVPKFLPGGTRNDLRCVSLEHKLGIHASPTCVMSYGDADQCIGWLVGPEHGGMRAMFTMMNNARLHVGLQGVQIAERATQLAIAYAKERIQSAKAADPEGGAVAIIEHPDVRRMLMRMKAQTQAIRALVYAAAAEVDRARLGMEGARSRLDLLTPLAKSHATDVGCEVASLGVQVHGGMGFIEETGAAQHYRDARIAPIYEGTNGIQAADLVGRKLTSDRGAAVRALIDDVLTEAQDPTLIALARSVEKMAWRLLEFQVDDRLAASTPFLTMISVMTCGWLMERQIRIATAQSNESGSTPFLRAKVTTGIWYLRHIIPEAMGLAASVEAGAAGLYELTAEELAA